MNRAALGFRALARGIGYVVVVSLALLATGLALRIAQVSFFYEPAHPEHANQKASYLAGISPAAPETAPNLVVILFDDLGKGDLSLYGNRLIDTPRIDRVADEGVSLSNFYSAAPVCTPSRAALLTGRYPIRSNTHQHVFFSEGSLGSLVRRTLGVGNEMPADEITIAEALGAAGYATGMVGKWHLGGLPGHLPNDFGFDEYYGVLWSNDMTPLHVYRDREIVIRDESDHDTGSYRDEDVPLEGGIDQSSLTAHYTREAIAFIERNRERPFFLYFSHTFPHVPHFASREHAGSSDGGIYGDVVEDLDRSVGAVLDAIDAAGLGERTLVLITSDNGADYNGNPGAFRGRKGETYEGGQRVPLLARFPGRLPAGVVRDAMAMNIDLFPTLLALAGAPLPDDRIIDGRDLFPLLENGGASAHDTLFYFPVVGGSPDAARRGSFKYLRESGDPGRSKPQLTHVGLDAENHNLILRFPEEASHLANALDSMDATLERNPRGLL
ncbi:MAG: sulfatase [Myxococcales bacterium]|nr:sulfatase [Myxococcales bacterium]